MKRVWVLAELKGDVLYTYSFAFSTSVEMLPQHISDDEDPTTVSHIFYDYRVNFFDQC